MTEWIAEGRRAGGLAAGVQWVAAGVQKVQEVQEVQEVLAVVQCIALHGSERRRGRERDKLLQRRYSPG